MRIRSCLLWAFVAPLLLVLACEADTRTGEKAAAQPPTRECEAYLEAYGTCMRHLSPQNPKVADARSEQARHALANITDPVLLRQTCVNGASQLHTSCP